MGYVLKMSENVIYDYGVDIDNSWTFSDGDLKLTKYEENLSQAICNRLNTGLDELYLFYYNYGSILKSFLGWKANEETLEFVKLEVDNCLRDDPRINSFTSEVVYDGDGHLSINLKVVYDGDMVDLNFGFDETGVLIEV